MDVNCYKRFLDDFLSSFHSLEKITHSSGGKYECVFLTDPEVKQTIEVKSKLCPFKSCLEKLLIDFGSSLNLSSAFQSSELQLHHRE